MTSSTKQQLIFNLSFGNLKAIEFATADEVEAKVDAIRLNFGYDKVEQDIRLGLVAFDYSDLAADRFEQIYDIAPLALMNILGN